ncbi:MAG: hypothetical protein AAF581_09635 [Planctomycetota bacterium]
MRLSVVVAVMLLTSLTTFAQDNNKPVELVFYHVRAAEGEKLELPKELRPFQKKLQRTLKEKFTIIGKPKVLKITGSLVTAVDMPGGIGNYNAHYDGKSGRLTIKFARNKKKLGSVSTSKFPLVAVNDKLKLGDDQFILIVAKKKPKG